MTVVREKTDYSDLWQRILQSAFSELCNGTLLPAIVHMIREEFSLYNVSLYLNDPLTLMASSGGKPVLPGMVIEQGLALRAYESQTPVFSTVPMQSGQFEVPPWINGNVRAEMAVPLLHQQQVIGVLDFFSRTEDAFNAQGLEELSALSMQVTALVESGQLFSQMEHWIDELSVLQDIAAQLLGSQDLDMVTRTIVDSFYDVLNASAVIVYAIQDNHILTPGVQHAQPGQHLADARILPLCHDALSSRNNLVIGQISGLPWKQVACLWTNRGGALVIPLSCWGTYNGILVIYYQLPVAFHTLDRQKLNSLVNLAATAMGKALRYEQRQHQLYELSLLYKMALKTREFTSFENVALAIAQALQETLDLQDVHIYGWDEVIEKFVCLSCEETPPRELGINEGMMGWVARHRRPLCLNPESAQIPEAMDWSGAEIALPLLVQDHLVGGMHICAGAGHPLCKRDQTFLSTVAHLLAVTLHNMKLYTQPHTGMYVGDEGGQVYEKLEAYEQQLKDAYQKLEDLTKLKHAMVQNISHEVRTPITFIKGYVELIAEGGMGAINEEQRHSLEIVSHKADEIVRIVNEIITLQPLASGDLERAIVPVEPMLQRVVVVFQRKTAGTDITLNLRSVESGLKIYGDLERVSQLCYNLLDNAVKFSPDGGHIWVSAECEDIYVHLTFVDEGVGISQNRISKVFDTFYQVDGSTSRRFGGLGLGLAVVKRVVDAHQGKIWVESEVGKGSTFHVLLPRYIPQYNEER